MITHSLSLPQIPANISAPLQTLETLPNPLGVQRSKSEGDTPAIVYLPYPFSEYKVGDEVELLQFDPDDSDEDDDDDWDPVTLSSVNGYQISAITKEEKIEMTFSTQEIKLRRVGTTEEEEETKVGDEIGAPWNIPGAVANPPADHPLFLGS